MVAGEKEIIAGELWFPSLSVTKSLGVMLFCTLPYRRICYSRTNPGAFDVSGMMLINYLNDINLNLMTVYTFTLHRHYNGDRWR